ncbi:hypothetical protein ID866_7799 [Astraeus odoratus]|nr:hypothetical protein ID866_7799 [Astraeus odoratus]
MFEVEEDEGQEDDLDADDEFQYIRLSTVRKYIINYLFEDRSMYIETDYCIYELHEPSKKYRREYRPFYKLHRIMQLIISSAYDDPEQQFADFVKHVISLEVLDQPIVERDLWDAVPRLRRVLETIEYGDRVRGSQIVLFLLSRDAPKVPKMFDISELTRRKAPPIPEIEYKGNPDLAVLRPENQVPTHVTPRIAQLATGLFKERLRVVGRRPQPERSLPHPELTERVKGFLMRVNMRRRIEFRPQQRLRPRSRYLKYLTIDGVDYAVGETVVFVAGNDGRSVPPALPHPDDVLPTDTLADYFWFARIVYIDGEDETVHVQWFDHSSKTCMEQLGQPQELFLTNRCDTVPMKIIIGRVATHYIAPGQSLADLKPHDFFYRYEWDDFLGTFKGASMEKLTSAQADPPPECCYVCDIMEQYNYDLHAHPLRHGVAWHARKYHIDDFVLIKAEEGPCHIGHISDIKLSPHSADDDDNKIVVTMLGRVDKLGCRPDTVLKDEVFTWHPRWRDETQYISFQRHLFYTDTQVVVVISDLVGICYVVVSSSLPEIEEWKAISPLHFYIKYRFPSLNVTSWNQRTEMQPQELDICRRCLKPNLDNFRDLRRFLDVVPPLRVFDPFAGVGSFSLAMEDSRCFKLTHAIEISPSAAQTLRYVCTPPVVRILHECFPGEMPHRELRFITSAVTGCFVKPSYYMRTSGRTN